MSNVSQTVGRYRWVIVSLLFFATTINYMDRQVISFLKPLFSAPVSEGGLGWSNTDYALITSSFTMLYAVITFFAGFIIDKIGTKIGLALSLTIWSLFGVLNAFAGGSVMAHVVIRSLFGIGEAGNFPSSIKAVTEWFPKKERALATGIFNSGSNVGAMIATLVVPFIAYRTWLGGSVQGWQMAFILTGLVGFVWLFFWMRLYDTKRLSQSELAYIRQDEVAAPAATDKGPSSPWYRLLAYRQTWSFIVLRFLTDGIWWFLLFWLPDFMKQQFGMEGDAIIAPLFIVYGISIVGSIFGGSISLRLVDKGMEPYKAKMTAMLLMAVLPLTLLLTQYFGNVERFGASSLWLALAVIALATAAHQAWAANMFPVIADLFPAHRVASVTGIGGLAGGVGGMVIQLVAGLLTDHYEATGNVQTAYGIMFCYCACAYLVGWSIMKACVPTCQRVNA